MDSKHKTEITIVVKPRAELIDWILVVAIITVAVVGMKLAGIVLLSWNIIFSPLMFCCILAAFKALADWVVKFEVNAEDADNDYDD